MKDGSCARNVTPVMLAAPVGLALSMMANWTSGLDLAQLPTASAMAKPMPQIRLEPSSTALSRLVA